jgi:hypothetical protein
MSFPLVDKIVIRRETCKVGIDNLCYAGSTADYAYKNPSSQTLSASFETLDKLTGPEYSTLNGFIEKVANSRPNIRDEVSRSSEDGQTSKNAKDLNEKRTDGKN